MPIQQFDMESGAGLVYVAELVNEYMQELAGYKRGIDIPLAKLIGDRLLQVHSGKQVEINY